MSYLVYTMSSVLYTARHGHFGLIDHSQRRPRVQAARRLNVGQPLDHAGPPPKPARLPPQTDRSLKSTCMARARFSAGVAPSRSRMARFAISRNAATSLLANRASGS